VSITTGGRREAARIAFRRRSISCEDAYAAIATGTCSSLTVSGGPHQLRATGSAKGSVETLPAGGATALSSRSTSGHLHSDGQQRNLQQQQRGGIICSNDDFKSLIAELGRHSKQSEMSSLTSPSCETSKANSGSVTPSAGAPQINRQSTPEVKNDDDEYLTAADFRTDAVGFGNCKTGGVRKLPTLCQPMKEYQRFNMINGQDKEHAEDSTDSAETTVIQESNDSPYLDSTSGRRQSMAPPDIEFDDNGQTWDVYGAELDPHILGSAIQSHLERIMTSAMQITPGLHDNDDVDDEAAIDNSTKDDRKTDYGNAETDSEEYRCERNRKTSCRKLMLCGGTAEPDCDDDDDNEDGELRDESQRSLLTRISCLCSE